MILDGICSCLVCRNLVKSGEAGQLRNATNYERHHYMQAVGNTPQRFAVGIGNHACEEAENQADLS